MQPIRDDSYSISFDPTRSLKLLWNWGWLISVVMLLSIALAYLISSWITPIYQASTSVMVNEAPSSRALDMSAITLSETLTLTYSQMMTKSMVLDEVARRVGLNMIDARNITVTPVRDTQLITITAKSTDPIQATQIANMLVMVFSEQIQTMQAERFAASKLNLQNRIAEIEEQIESTNNELSHTFNPDEKVRLDTKITNLRQIYANLLQSYEQIRLTEAQTVSSLVQIEPAVVPSKPLRPNPSLYMSLAGVISLLIASGLIIIFDALDDKLNTPKEVVEKLHLPVLGVIPHYHHKDGAITEVTPRSPVSEAYRILRTNIRNALEDLNQPVSSILVTSPLPEEGKTNVAVNLAVVLAHSDRRVILLDADLRRPSVHKILGLENRSGLSDFFEHVNRWEPLDGGKDKSRKERTEAENSSLYKVDIEEVSSILKETATHNLYVITSGTLPSQPAEMLGSKRMSALLQHLKKFSEVIVIDTPPSLIFSDSAELALLADSVILVVKPGATRLGTIRENITQFNRLGIKILGLVLNNIEVGRANVGYYRSDVDRYFHESRPAPSPVQVVRFISSHVTRLFLKKPHG